MEEKFLHIHELKYFREPLHVIRDSTIEKDIRDIWSRLK